MARIIVSFVTVLLTIGGMGVAFSNWSNNYDFYNSPSSGFLGSASTDTDVSNASPRFDPVPDGGFGPPTGSFQNPDEFPGLSQTRTDLQFNDRWLFDYWPGGHPHHARRHRVQ